MSGTESDIDLELDPFQSETGLTAVLFTYPKLFIGRVSQENPILTLHTRENTLDDWNRMLKKFQGIKAKFTLKKKGSLDGKTLLGSPIYSYKGDAATRKEGDPWNSWYFFEFGLPAIEECGQYECNIILTNIYDAPYTGPQVELRFGRRIGKSTTAAETPVLTDDDHGQ